MPTPSFVQGTGSQFNAGLSSRSLAFVSNVVAGNILVAAGGNFNQNMTITGCSDSQGNTYTERVWVTRQTGGIAGKHNSSLWTAVAGSSGANTVTMTMDAADFISIGIAEIGVSSPDYSVTLTSSGTLSDPAVIGNITTSYAAAILAFLNQTSGTTFSAGTNYTMIASNGSATFEPFAWEYRIVTAGGTYAVTFGDNPGTSISANVVLAIQSAGGFNALNIGF